ncbi:MAG: hypothetical protein NC191_01620 [Muribaculaceae bacterium]|nr:hypothetical protein [Muribaculaceae bacterium]
MKTLHEMATKLQTFIIKAQEDAHNQANLSIAKYNNLKLKIESKYHFPNVVVCIGISEAVFNIKEGTKVDGGLGPDEKHVRKWLGNSTTISDLNEIWLSMSELIKAADEDKVVELEGEAEEAKNDAPKKKNAPEIATIEEFFRISDREEARKTRAKQARENQKTIFDSIKDDNAANQ